jgi:hypothetical protein
LNGQLSTILCPSQNQKLAESRQYSLQILGSDLLAKQDLLDVVLAIKVMDKSMIE